MSKTFAARIQAANQALLAGGEIARIGEFFTKDYVAHLTKRDLAGGHGAVRRYLKLLRGGFPALEVKVEILLAGKDRVAWQRTLRGVHEGRYAGFPATHKKITWRDMLVSRFAGGLICEEWASSDLAERLLLARKR